MNHSEELKKLYEAIAKGADAVITFYDQLIAKESSTEELVEFAFQVLETSTEATQYTAIYRAGFIIEDWAKAESLDRLIASRNKLPALKGLRDYRVDFDLYIGLLKSMKAGICKCGVYSSYNTSPSHKLFVVESSAENQQTYAIETLVHCSLCNKKYKVETDYSYHYPISRWS